MTLAEDRFIGPSQCEERRLTSQAPQVAPQKTGVIRTGAGPGQGDYRVK